MFASAEDSMTMDARDFPQPSPFKTPAGEPVDPGHLDPDWILKMRMYLAGYVKTGRVIWVERGRRN